MTRGKLFRRDFTLVVVGQIISLLGNAVLRFVLLLYLLDVTGSRSLLACALPRRSHPWWC